MNIWYIVALSLIVLGVLFFVGCIFASVFAISKTVTILQQTIERIQTKQMAPLQNQMNSLNQTVNVLKSDVENKKNNLQYVTECFKGIKNNVESLNETSKLLTKRTIEKVENDPQLQAQTEQWTNQALGFLKRN